MVQQRLVSKVQHWWCIAHQTLYQDEQSRYGLKEPVFNANERPIRGISAIWSRKFGTRLPFSFVEIVFITMPFVCFAAAAITSTLPCDEPVDRRFWCIAYASDGRS